MKLDRYSSYLLLQIVVDPPAHLFNGVTDAQLRLANLQNYYQQQKYVLQNLLAGEEIEMRDLPSLGAMVVLGSQETLDRLRGSGGLLQNTVELCDNSELLEQELCRGCQNMLLLENLRIADGCPCNSPRGVNHGLVPKNTCTCQVCDPAQTGSTRYIAGI